MLVAAIKAVSLAYLLGLVTLSLATFYWWAAGRLVAPRHRASASFWMLITVAVLTLACTAYILWGVLSFRIVMITDYFHRLMDVGWSAVIVVGGLAVLIISLLLAYISWRRGRVPQAGDVLLVAEGMTVRASGAPDTASLVGVIHPEIWVNPEYWTLLDEQQKSALLTHELVHLRRRDNLKKLVVQFISTLYYAIPWLKSWPGQFNFHTEMAVDDACQRKLGKGAYMGLIGDAASFVLQRYSGAVASHFGETDMVRRLRVLDSAQPAGHAGVVTAVGLMGTAVSMLPAAGLLYYPISRCLLACYLGY